MELKVWMLSGIVVLLLGALSWVVKKAINGIYSRLDKMILQNSTFGKALVSQGKDIYALKNQVQQHDKRINNHADRIREIELKQAKK